MKEEDIIKDILEKYPEEKILKFCSDAICRAHIEIIKTLKGGKPELVSGILGEAFFPLHLLQSLSDKKNDSDKETVVVA